MKTRKPKILNEVEFENWVRFHKRGCTPLTRCKINQLNLDNNNSRDHNIKMLYICRGLLEQKKSFITEAVSNKNKRRRVDIYNISDDQIIEIEVTGKTKSDADITYKLNKDGYWDIIRGNLNV